MTPHAAAVERLQANADRRILLPDVLSFGELFAEAQPWTYGPPHAFGPTRIHMRNEPVLKLYAAVFGGPKIAEDYERGNELGPYCHVEARGGRWALDVRPTDAVVEAVAERIMTPDDRLSFRIIEHAESGWALVIAQQHGQILGDHWLAYVDPTGIPLPTPTGAVA